MEQSTEIFVGIDVSKARNAIAVASDGRDGEVRFVGEVDWSVESMRPLIKRITAKHAQAHFCYEAGAIRDQTLAIGAGGDLLALHGWKREGGGRIVEHGERGVAREAEKVGVDNQTLFPFKALCYARQPRKARLMNKTG